MGEYKMTELNQWGDPVNTVYVVMMGGAENGTLVRVFKDWKAANEYADAEYAKARHEGYSVDFTVCAETLY